LVQPGPTNEWKKALLAITGSARRPDLAWNRPPGRDARQRVDLDLGQVPHGLARRDDQIRGEPELGEQHGVHKRDVQLVVH